MVILAAKSLPWPNTSRIVVTTSSAWLSSLLKISVKVLGRPVTSHDPRWGQPTSGTPDAAVSASAGNDNVPGPHEGTRGRPVLPAVST